MRWVAVTQRIDHIAEYKESRQGFDIKWSEFFKRHQIMPIILPYGCDFLPYFSALDITGILITGGNDLTTVTDTPENRMRQSYENQLIDFAIHEDLPVWGVCHGMQIIGDYFGEKLAKIEGHAASQHKVMVSREARFYDQIADIAYENSFHQYGFKTLSEAFQIVATAQDGSIEAFEHKRHKVFGQMWHPERAGTSGILYGLI